jgi:hypothetical protein
MARAYLVKQSSNKLLTDTTLAKVQFDDSFYEDFDDVISMTLLITGSKKQTQEFADTILLEIEQKISDLLVMHMAEDIRGYTFHRVTIYHHKFIVYYAILPDGNRRAMYFRHHNEDA